MRDKTKKRLAEVALAIGSRPIPTGLVREAFERFCSTGELPDDERLVSAVVARVRNGFESVTRADGEVDWGATIQAAMQAKPRQDKVMDGLLFEAVRGPAMVRAAAREVLRGMASAGLDVTEAQFANQELPEYGAVAMTFVGFPERLAKTPYKAQAKRLFARIDKLRPRLPQDDRRWFERLGDATERFQFDGERPDDERMLDAILALGEVTALLEHACGEDVADVLAAFDAAGTTRGAEREAAIARLQELARAGAFAPAAS